MKFTKYTYIVITVALMVLSVRADGQNPIQNGWSVERVAVDSGLVASDFVDSPPQNSTLEALPKPNKIAVPSKIAEPLAASSELTAAEESMRAEPLAVSSDVMELAQALEYDIVRIFEFVRNEIEYDFQYGWVRSPERTLMDGMGTDADQALLLAELLLASGYQDVTYWVADLWYEGSGNDGYNFKDWLGLEDARHAWDVLMAKGFPSRYNPTYNMVRMRRIWIGVQDGPDYWHLDPAMVPHIWHDPSGIQNLCGYNRTNLLNQLGGLGTAHVVQGADETSLRSHLSSLTETLLIGIKQDFPNSSALDLIGGKEAIRNEGLYNVQMYNYENAYYYDSISHCMYQHYIRFDNTIGPLEFATPELRADPLSLELEGDGFTGEILLNDVSEYRGPLLDGSGKCRITYYRPLLVPYGNPALDEWEVDWNAGEIVRDYPISPSSVVAFPILFGDATGDGLFDSSEKRLSKSYEDGASSDETTRASLHSMGSSWLNQRRLIGQLFRNLFDPRETEIFNMGAFHQSPNGLSCDIKNSHSLLFGEKEEFLSLFRGPLFFASALEHGVLEQAQPSSADAVSTVELLTLASRQGDPLYLFSASNATNAASVLTNYSSGEIQRIIEVASKTNGVAFVHQDAAVQHNQWTGFGYILSDEEFGQFAIGGGIQTLNGGYETTGASHDPGEQKEIREPFSFEKTNKTNPESNEPVDLVTGAYVADFDDLRMDGPMGFGLSRHYSSKTRYNKTSVGYGWNHSLNMRVVESSDTDAMLGKGSSEEVAVMAIAVSVVKDLLQNENTAQSWLAATLTTKWAMDQMTKNVATVVTGRKASTFLKKPDGSFMPPPGITASLIETNGTYVMQERHGNTFQFNTNGRIETVSDPHGNTLSFDYEGGTNLNWVQSSFGPTFTFGYTGGLLTSVADNSTPSRTVHYEYDANNNLIHFTDAAGFGWVITYDDGHKIKTLVDPEGITTIQNFYNSIGQVTNQLSATGHPWNFYYAGSHTVEEDPYGNQTTYHIDGLQRTWSVERADGSRTYTFYDGQNHVTNAISAAGVTNLFVYDTDHNLLAQTNAVGTAEQVANAFGYDAEHRLCFVTNALGTAEQAVTEFTYTAQHKFDTVTVAKGTPVETVADYDYTAEGLLQQLSEGNGKRITTYSNFDSYGNAQTIQSTDAGAIGRTFDIRGDLKALTADGKTSAFGYDARRLPVAITNALGTADQVVTSKTYYDNGLLESETDARGKTKGYYYYASYKLQAELFPDTSYTFFQYDDADRLIHSWDRKLDRTDYTLDEVGRVLLEERPNLSITNQFDAIGNLTNSVVDPSGLNLWTAIEYDPLNRMRNRQSAIGNRQFEYDALGRQTNTVDAAEKSWKTQYDALGRVRKSFRPSNNYEEYGYDALGNRTHFWNAEFKPTTFGVDAQGRVTSITNAIQKVTSFTFDDSGNLKQRTAADLSATDYGYDALNRLVTVTNGGVEVATFDHDPNGNVVSHKEHKNNIEVGFGYDSMNRLTASTQTVASVSSLVQNQYDLTGNRTNIVYPGGLTVGYVYGADNRLESVTTKYAGNTKTVSFGYDTASRLAGISYPNDVASTFGLDAEGRVTSIQHGSFVDRTIQRNMLGFKETELIDAGLKPTAPATKRRLKTHNDADQLVSEQVQDGSNWTTVAYGYSANGCLTNNSETDQSFAYDYDNRLASVDGVEYLYDASGARVCRIAGGSPAVTNYFVIDYTDGLKRPLAETDASGTVTRYYVWSGARLLCHIEANGSVRYYHADEFGSTLALTDASGSVTDQFAYMPYGYANHSGTTSTPFQWLGGYGVYYDSGTALHLTLYRAYSCNLKRFLHPDPLGIDGGPNVYMWANMNPLAFVDPYGLCAESFNWSANGGINDFAIGGPFNYGPPSIESLPYGNQINSDSWNNASYSDKVATYITLSEMERLGITPNGSIYSSGEGILIPGGISGDTASLQADSTLPYLLKNAKEGFTLDSSSHVPGSPSLNAASYTDGRQPFYDIDLNNPNSGLGSLGAHTLDAANQWQGNSLSGQSFNEMSGQGKIWLWYPPE